MRWDLDNVGGGNEPPHLHRLPTRWPFANRQREFLNDKLLVRMAIWRTPDDRSPIVSHQKSTVTSVNRRSTFALRRSTLNFCLGGQRSLRAAQRAKKGQFSPTRASPRSWSSSSSSLTSNLLKSDQLLTNASGHTFWSHTFECELLLPPLKSISRYDRLGVGWLNGFWASLGGVPREQKMLKGHLPRVIYHQVYQYTKTNETL